MMDAREVGCPFCLAMVGRNCRTQRGRMLSVPHMARVHRAFRAQERKLKKARELILTYTEDDEEREMIQRKLDFS